MQALCCSPFVFPHWPRCHFSLWSLAGHVGVVWAHWQFTVVCEQEMRFLSCRVLCCKLTTAVCDLPGKTPNPSTASSPQPPEISCSSTQPFIFCPANQPFSYLLSPRNPPQNAMPLHCPREAPLFSPLLPSMMALQPLALCTFDSLPPQQCHAKVQ